MVRLSFKRRLARFIERVSGNLVVPPQTLHSVHKEQHLRKFFSYFNVDCVFDVGANRGQYARMLRDQVGFKGFIISYEPIPALAESIRGEAANDPHWYVEEKAMDHEVGRKTFHITQNSEFSSLCLPTIKQPNFLEAHANIIEEVEVACTTLSHELSRWREKLGFERPYLKLDTQGNELSIVIGSREHIGQFIGLESELTFSALYADSPEYQEVLTVYRSLGFDLSAIVPNNEGHFPLLIEIDAIMYRRSAVDG